MWLKVSEKSLKKSGTEYRANYKRFPKSPTFVVLVLQTSRFKILLEAIPGHQLPHNLQILRL